MELEQGNVQVEDQNQNNEEIVMSRYECLPVDEEGTGEEPQQEQQQMEEQVLGYLEVQPSQLQAVQDGGTIYFQSDGLNLNDHFILNQGEEGEEIIVVVRSDQDLPGEVGEGGIRTVKLEDLQGLSQHLSISSDGKIIGTLDEKGGYQEQQQQQLVLQQQDGETVTIAVSESDMQMLQGNAIMGQDGQQILHLPMSSEGQVIMPDGRVINTNVNSLGQTTEVIQVAQEGEGETQLIIMDPENAEAGQEGQIINFSTENHIQGDDQTQLLAEVAQNGRFVFQEEQAQSHMELSQEGIDQEQTIMINDHGVNHMSETPGIEILAAVANQIDQNKNNPSIDGVRENTEAPLNETMQHIEEFLRTGDGINQQEEIVTVPYVNEQLSELCQQQENYEAARSVAETVVMASGNQLIESDRSKIEPSKSLLKEKTILTSPYRRIPQKESFVKTVPSIDPYTFSPTHKSSIMSHPEMGLQKSSKNYIKNLDTTSTYDKYKGIHRKADIQSTMEIDGTKKVSFVLNKPETSLGRSPLPKTMIRKSKEAQLNQLKPMEDFRVKIPTKHSPRTYSRTKKPVEIITVQAEMPNSSLPDPCPTVLEIVPTIEESSIETHRVMTDYRTQQEEILEAVPVEDIISQPEENELVDEAANEIEQSETVHVLEPTNFAKTDVVEDDRSNVHTENQDGVGEILDKTLDELPCGFSTESHPVTSNDELPIAVEELRNDVEEADQEEIMDTSEQQPEPELEIKEDQQPEETKEIEATENSELSEPDLSAVVSQTDLVSDTQNITNHSEEEMEVNLDDIALPLPRKIIEVDEHIENFASPVVDLGTPVLDEQENQEANLVREEASKTTDDTLIEIPIEDEGNEKLHISDKIEMDSEKSNLSLDSVQDKEEGSTIVRVLEDSKVPEDEHDIVIVVVKENDLPDSPDSKIDEDSQDQSLKDVEEAVAVEARDKSAEDSQEKSTDSREKRVRRAPIKRKLFEEDPPPKKAKVQNVKRISLGGKKGSLKKQKTQSQDELFDQLIRNNTTTDSDSNVPISKKRKKGMVDRGKATLATNNKRRRTLPSRNSKNDSSDEEEIVLSNLRTYPEAQLTFSDFEKKQKGKPKKVKVSSDEIEKPLSTLREKKALSEPIPKKGKQRKLKLSKAEIAFISGNASDTSEVKEVEITKKVKGKPTKSPTQPTQSSSRGKTKGKPKSNGLIGHVLEKVDCQFHIRPQCTSKSEKSSPPIYTCKECHYKTQRLANLVRHYKDCSQDMFPFNSQGIGERTPNRFTLDAEKTTSRSLIGTPRATPFKTTPISKKGRKGTKRGRSSTRGDKNSQSEEPDASEGCSSDDELPPAFQEEMKNAFGFAEHDVVWAEYKGQNWPSLVKKIYPKTKKASILFIETPMKNKTFKVAIQKITNFDNAEKNKLFLSEGYTQENKDELINAVQLAEDYLRKQCLGLNISPYDFFNNPKDVRLYLNELEEATAEEEQAKIEGEPMEQDPQADNGSADEKPQDSEVIVVISSGQTEENLGIESAETKVQQLKKELKKTEAQKLVKCIKEGKTDNHLLGVYNAIVSSHRHRLFHSSIASERSKVKRSSYFGMIIEEDMQTEVVQYCMDLFGNSIKADDSFHSVGYAFEVMAPEALVKAISLVHNVSIEEAENIFLSNESLEGEGKSENNRSCSPPLAQTSSIEPDMKTENTT